MALTIHWMNDIKGPENTFEFNIGAEYDSNNLLMLSEEEYWVLALSRAFKKTFDKDFIFNNESHGRDDSIANLNRAVVGLLAYILFRLI